MRDFFILSYRYTNIITRICEFVNCKNSQLRIFVIIYRKVELKLCIIDNIIEILEKKHLKQSDLCAYIGINTSTMTTWKSRKTDPPAKYIILICEFLNISPYVLLTGKEKNVPMEQLSKNKQEMLDIFSKFDDREQIKLIGRLEELYRQKQIKEDQHSVQKAYIAARSYDNHAPETVVGDFSEIFNAPDATDKYK